MDKNKQMVEACIYKLYDFRSKIPANLSMDKINSVWGKGYQTEQSNRLIEEKNWLIDKKIKKIVRNLDWLVVEPFVKFIGISGSVASEFVQEDDDIDLFIVVKNDSAWIYRFFLYLRNLSRHKIRSKEKSDRGDSVKDKFCVNLVTEERSLSFEGDMFNLNELLYLRAVYNKEFLKIIFLNNPWLSEKYLVSDSFLSKEDVTVGDVKDLTKSNYILMIFNFFLFLGQVFFMLIMKHSPDIRRLWNGFKKGRIEFYPKDFKNKKLKDFKSH